MAGLAAGMLPLFLATLTVSAQAPPIYQAKEEKLPQEVAAQPVPFSHKKHAPAGITCLDCHGGAPAKERAGLPDAAACLLCHSTISKDHPAIQKLAALHRAGEAVAWVRVYKVPDFVFFSHASHMKAGEKCITCHGPIETRDTLAKEISTSMTACMNCHAARKVSTECFLCHELGH